MPDIRPALQSAADRMIHGTSAIKPRLRTFHGRQPIQTAHDSLVRGTQGIGYCPNMPTKVRGLGDLNGMAMLGFLGVMGALYFMSRK